MGASVNRRGRDFSQEQCAALELLRPHLLQAYRTEQAATQSAEHHGGSASRREAKTLFWVGQGKANDEIGIIMGIAKRTVEKYVERLFEKLDVYNRTAAARLAMGK